MSTFWDNLKETTRDLADKTNEALETGKLKLEVTGYKRKIDRCHREIGEMVARAFEGEADTYDLDNPAMRALMGEVSAYKRAIEDLEARMAAPDSE
ncbi:MAG: hypothetical protein RhofKO_17140 [Rhodothermales bacterium]